MRNEVPAFGFTLSEYEDKPSFSEVYFEWNIAKLETRKEVLEWYINFNSGGTVHTEKELDRVRELLKKEG